MAQALRVNQTLNDLDLNWNTIGDGAIALGEALRVNQTLTQLHLGGNQLGAQGVQAIAQALRVNRTLTHLYLYHNEIGVEGAQAIAQSLRFNRTLTYLTLGNNLIGDQQEQGVLVIIKNARERLRRSHHVLSDLIGDEQSLISTLPYDMCLINEIIQLADESIPDCRVSFE